MIARLHPVVVAALVAALASCSGSGSGSGSAGGETGAGVAAGRGTAGSAGPTAVGADAALVAAGSAAGGAVDGGTAVGGDATAADPLADPGLRRCSHDDDCVVVFTGTTCLPSEPHPVARNKRGAVYRTLRPRRPLGCDRKTPAFQREVRMTLERYGAGCGADQLCALIDRGPQPPRSRRAPRVH